MTAHIKSEEAWAAEGLGIAGRQLIKRPRGIKTGDMAVGIDGQDRQIFKETYTGKEMKEILYPGDRIYRTMPTPKQTGDSCMDKFYDECKAAGFDPDKPCKDNAVDCKAKTYDDGKAPLAYIPWAAVDEMAMVQAYGQKKYSDWNNYRKGMEVGRNLSCALRHIRDFMNGIDVDSESGRSHLGHAMTRIAFVIQNLKDGTAIDDRYKKP